MVLQSVETEWQAPASTYAKANSFTDILTLKQCPPADDDTACLFSRGTALILRTHDFDLFGYPYIQVFEANVLAEIANLQRISFDKIEILQSEFPVPEGHALFRITQPETLSDVQLTNNIGCLISLSRFTQAKALCALLQDRSLDDRAQFELSWLSFLISNRCDDGASSQAHFDHMRTCIEIGDISDGRIIDVCTQGVVWHLKRREVNAETFQWCLKTGHKLAHGQSDCDPETVSGWFRGLAMLPAAAGDKVKTRDYMLKAKETALKAVEQRPDMSLKAINQLKTFYESSIKEFLYVDRDQDKALQSALALIDLDPHWSLNFSETADIFKSFGDLEQAGLYYDKAASLGPPYLGLNLTSAIQCFEGSGRDQEADRCRHHLNQLFNSTT